MKRSRGFTIIELLVVIAIVAILATLAIPSYLDFFEKGRVRGATEAVYEQLQHARTLSIKKSTPIIVDFWIDGSDATKWAIGITDESGGCDAMDTTTDPCTIEYDNDPNKDSDNADGDNDENTGMLDPVLMRMEGVDFTNITMTAPVFGASAGPGTCSTTQTNEACFEPVQGLARSPTSHIQLKSSNNTYTLQVEIDATGRVKICVPSGKFIGYEGC